MIYIQNSRTLKRAMYTISHMLAERAPIEVIMPRAHQPLSKYCVCVCVCMCVCVYVCVCVCVCVLIRIMCVLIRIMCE